MSEPQNVGEARSFVSRGPGAHVETIRSVEPGVRRAESEPSVVFAKAKESMRLCSLRINSPFPPNLLHTLGVLGAKAPSEFTTEGIEPTEIHIRYTCLTKVAHSVYKPAMAESARTDRPKGGGSKGERG